MLIEYSHRLVAALASILIVATIVMAMRRSGQPAIRRMGWTLLVLLAAQIGLGGITVLLKLPDLISTAHLVNALLIFGGLLVLAASERGPATPAAAIARLARAGLGALLVQLALGGYVRHSGAGLACPDFPLCSGAVLPGHWLAVAHWTHRWLGVLLLGLFVHLGIAGRGTPLARATSAAALLAVVQVALGIATVLLRLDPPIRAAHAAVGYALWGAGGVDRGEIGRREPPHRPAAGGQAGGRGAPCLGWRRPSAERGSIAVFARIGAYAELSKFGIVLLVLVSAAAGFMLTAPLGPSFPWRDGLLMLAGVMLLSCGASALNQVQERDAGRADGANRRAPAALGPPVRAAGTPLRGARDRRGIPDSLDGQWANGGHPRPHRRRLLQWRLHAVAQADVPLRGGARRDPGVHPAGDRLGRRQAGA